MVLPQTPTGRPKVVKMVWAEQKLHIRIASLFLDFFKVLPPVFYYISSDDLGSFGVLRKQLHDRK